jgi:DNA invertase Pin-like site-specific DNA recombinase
MIKQVKRAALYVRVSTDHQTLENQIHELTQIAERRGWEVVEIYKDHGISGAKGRDKRPGLDLMLTDASRRKFDVVMSWAIDRLGRSLTDLLGTIQHLEACDLRLGRPGAEQHKIEEARKLLASGIGIRKIGRMVGLGASTAQRLKNEMVEAREAA